MYEGARLSIPLDCNDHFWRKLDLLLSVDVEYGDLGYEKYVKMFLKKLSTSNQNPSSPDF
ncbi:hypothetical protein R6Q59_012424 [Mikania micrantha]